jgi:histidinol phosphatase-like enzyme
MMISGRVIICIDRDAVINESNKTDITRGPFVLSSDDFLFRPGVLDALALLHDAGCRCVVLTSQNCVTLDLLTIEELNNIHTYMLEVVAAHQGLIEHIEVVYSKDDSDDNVAGKTVSKVLGLINIKNKFNITKGDIVWHIGDSVWELNAGREFEELFNITSKTIQIKVKNYNKDIPSDYKADSLLDAAKIIIEEIGKNG